MTPDFPEKRGMKKRKENEKTIFLLLHPYYKLRLLKI